MNDIDFISELIAMLEFGFSDKKEKVDALYATDITDIQYQLLKKRAEAVLTRIGQLNVIVPLNRTRFKQKGDFYTLFGFLANNLNLSAEYEKRIYQILLRLSHHIRPSQEECDPLMEYAVNCVTQSNSKKARETRNKLFEELFLNSANQPNPTQKAIAKYLHISEKDYERIGSFLVWQLEALDKVVTS